ncbi:hypothetical protein QL285_007115 [Trifolium repens]|nr:hypothetical protein QL285_007115 [Trifolium repens]
MDMCVSFWLFNSNPEAMCCKCLIETLTELMSKLGIVEESSKPSLAYLPRKKFLTDFTLNSNVAPIYSNAAPTLYPPSTPQVTLAVFPPTPPQPSLVDRFLLPSTPLPLPTLPPTPPSSPFCIEKGFRFSQFYEQLAAIQCLNGSKCKSAQIPQSFALETLCVSCIICKLKDLRPAMKTVVGASHRLSRRFSSSPPRVRFPTSHYVDTEIHCRLRLLSSLLSFGWMSLVWDYSFLTEITAMFWLDMSL